MADDCRTEMDNSGGESRYFVVDHLNIMLHQESNRNSRPPSNFLQENTNLPSSHGHWRQTICEWGYDVVDHFKFNREVVEIFMNYLDRYVSSTLSKGVNLSRRSFQLVAVSSLYLSMKLHGEADDPKKMVKTIDMSTFVKLSRNIFPEETIEEMELDILFTLDWRMNPPTMARFITDFFELFPSRPPAVLIERSRYVAEMSVCVASLSIEQRPSVVAFSAILNAMDSMNMMSLQHEIYQVFLDNIERATSLSKKMSKIEEVRAMLNNMCPIPTDDVTISLEDSNDSFLSIYNHTLRTEHFASGKTSPVCVAEAHMSPPPLKRKRSDANNAREKK